MRPPVSATLAVWASAWLSGTARYDDVLDAVTADGGSHVVVGMPAAEAARQGGGFAATAAGSFNPGPTSAGPAGEESFDEPARLGAVLLAWRAAGESVRTALPVPGDVRGVPTTAAFLAAATEVGQAAFAGGLGVVPTVSSPSPSSAPPTTVWRAFAVASAAPDALQISEAEHDLAVAVRETTTLLRERDLSGGRTPDAAALERIRRASEGLLLPPGFSPRAAALLASAERLQAMVDLAARDVDGGAIDRAGIHTRTAALRDLAVTVRRARLAGYNAPWS